MIPLPRRRRRPALLVAVAAVAMAGSLTPAPALAEPGYRYWGFYTYDAGRWTFANKGPTDIVPPDGAVQGWRFAVTVGTTPRPPRADGRFARICSGVRVPAGDKRVAVVLDFGTAADAPTGRPPQPIARGECAVVPENASSLAVLEQVARVRAGQGLVCGIDGYPASGCAEEVADADVPSTEQPVQLALGQDQAHRTSADDGGFPWSLSLVGVAVTALAAATLLRRRSS